MKLTILVVLIAASLLWAVASVRHDCTTGSCASVPTPMVAGRLV